MSDTERDSTQVLLAECPMSWCHFTAVVEDPDGDYDAALEIQEHVNEDHSEKDLDTLDSVDVDNDRPDGGDDAE